MKSEMAGFDETRVSYPSRQFAERLFVRFPELKRYAAMERAAGDAEWTLVVEVPAPSGEEGSRLVIWVDEGREPSVAYGAWHTHESVWTSPLGKPPNGSILDLVDGILTDRYALCEDIGGEADGSTTILDLTDRNAILEELTGKYSPGCVRIRSWSGRHDRVVDLDRLKDEESA